jgi:PncC family amidohydrolase
VAGASEWFRGSIVSYSSDVKHALLGVPAGPVVSAEAAQAMASGAVSALGASVGLAVTGVAGPTEQDGMPVGTVFCAVQLDGAPSVAELHLPGDRERVRWYSTISALDLLRRRLLGGR